MNSLLLCKHFEDFCNRCRLTHGVQAPASSPQHLLLWLCQGFLRSVQVQGTELIWSSCSLPATSVTMWGGRTTMPLTVTSKVLVNFWSEHFSVHWTVFSTHDWAVLLCFMVLFYYYSTTGRVCILHTDAEASTRGHPSVIWCGVTVHMCTCETGSGCSTTQTILWWTPPWPYLPQCAGSCSLVSVWVPPI